VTMIQRKDLKTFQERAASELAAMIQEYPSDRFKPRFDPETGDRLPFLCRLRAITGAGKTPILALTAQHLRNGIVLWTTNRGAVISQTLANLRAGGKYSGLLPEGTQIYNLAEMTPLEWSQMIEAREGLTILLATVASFNQDGDNLKIHKKVGDVTRWQMLSGDEAVDERRARSLYVFYDEGHGATENQFRKLRELHPAAFTLASASPLPEDLADLLSGNSQEERQKALALRTVSVPTKEVVGTGLLKQRLYFVDCNTAKSDAIREANDKWASIAKKMKNHSSVPIACFIVNETTRGVDIWEHLVALGVDPARIAVHLNGARDVMADRRGVVAPLIDTYSGRKPQDRSPEVLASAGYTHIIWNLTLREGWDEPLAYVAYLDSRGRSLVDIVQKIGRFVRQPNAKPFSDTDLNSAYFYFNVTDAAFSRIIEQTQEEMETDGYEVIPMVGARKPPASRSVPVKAPMSLTNLAPWFGDSIEDLDDILLNAVPLFADAALQSRGAFKTRVFEMREMKENVEKRSERSRATNDVVTPWEFLSAHLGAIDARIINDSGTIFSARLKDEPRMRQQMQHGSEAMRILSNAIPNIRARLNDKFQLRGLGRHGIHVIQPFNLVSPDIESGHDGYREKYKVRKFKNALHGEYNGFNPFELDVAQALDRLGKPWCRNPVGRDGYKIPVQELGADSNWFYPDFLFWSKPSEVWAIDPKGKHLLDAAVPSKLMDLGGLPDIKPRLQIAFLVEGQYVADQQGFFTRAGRQGLTLVRRDSTKIKTIPLTDIDAAVKQF